MSSFLLPMLNVLAQPVVLAAFVLPLNGVLIVTAINDLLTQESGEDSADHTQSACDNPTVHSPTQGVPA